MSAFPPDSDRRSDMALATKSAIDDMTRFFIADIKLALDSTASCQVSSIRITWMEALDNLSSVWEMVAKNLIPKRGEDTNRRDK